MASGSITSVMVDALRGTKPWTMLIGILMFIGTAFMVLAGLMMMVGSAAMGAAQGGPPAGIMVGLGGVYLVMAVIYVFLGLYLVRYSSAVGRFVSAGQTMDMESALQQQQKFWKLAGVLAIITIVVVVLAMIAAIALPAFMMSQGGGLQ
jgi:hypothetical protein